MSILDCRLEKNVLSFLEIYTHDQERLSALKKKSVGLTDPNLEQNFLEGNFSAVLTALWSEPDLEKRLLWLISKSEYLHPILLYEEATTKFRLSPTQSTLVKECLPLLHSAHFRSLQDAQCSLNTTIKMFVVPRIYELYRIRLGNLVFKKFQTPFFEYELRHQNRVLNEQKVFQIAQKTLKSPLSDPVWIGYTGMNRFSVGQPKMVTAEDFVKVRHEFARQKLSHPFLKSPISDSSQLAFGQLGELIEKLKKFF